MTAPKKPTTRKPAAKKAAGKGKASPRQKLPHGRPSLYRPEYDELAYKFCLLGADDAKLADLFKVTEDTIYEWKKVHPTFSDSITRGKEIADAEIAEALYHRAKGYSHKEDDIRTVTLPQGGGSEIVITPTVKHYPPDTQAASLWLRNRQPRVWRDKVDLEHTGKDGGPIEQKVSGDLNVTLTPAEAYMRMLGGDAK